MPPGGGLYIDLTIISTTTYDSYEDDSKKWHDVTDRIRKYAEKQTGE